MLFEDAIIHARCNSNPHLSFRCACGSCVAVENPIEAVCCREIGAVVNLLEEEEATCNTEHLGSFSRTNIFCIQVIYHKTKSR